MHAKLAKAFCDKFNPDQLSRPSKASSTRKSISRLSF
jgi:hypothetical protein